VYLDPQKIEMCAYALAEATYAKLGELDPKDPRTQAYAKAKWESYIPAVTIVLTCYEDMRNDNDN
jgi:hypothetical protein